MRRGLVWCVLACLACGSDAKRSDVPEGTLELVREQKLSKLLPSSLSDFEASGVAFGGGSLAIAFDNATRIGFVDVALTGGTLSPGMSTSSQYEGITFGGSSIYVAREASPGQIITTDANGVFLRAEPTDVTFPDGNKGLEGLAWVGVGGVEHLLALGEGDGRVRVLGRSAGGWATEATLEVPSELHFDDYSDIAVIDRGDGSFRIAVTSQQSSAVWVGVLVTSPWQIVGPGVRYRFPKTADKKVGYCNIEGVTFLDQTTIAVVSDRAGKDEADCKNADESIHIFRLR